MNARDRLRNYEPHPGCPNMKLRALIAVNGAKQFALWCMEKDYPTRGSFIPHHIVRAYLEPLHVDADQIDVIVDNRCNSCRGEGCDECCDYACERCNQYRRLEFHHWAPRYLFHDADEWPGGWLCRECHQRWHQVVTPNMHMRRAG